MKKVICTALLTAMILTVAGCGGSTDSAANSTDIGTSSAAADQHTTETATVQSSEVAEETDSQAEKNNTAPFEFPVQCIGGYSDRNHYSPNYVIVEAQKITVCDGGVITEYDFSDCIFESRKPLKPDENSLLRTGVIKNSNGYTVGVQQNGKVSLYDIDAVIHKNEYIEIGDKELTKRTVVNNMPMADYVSLDDEGEFGILDVPDEIKSVIENEAGDDYIIRYSEREGIKRYLLSCFNEDELMFKQIKFVNDGNGYIREDQYDDYYVGNYKNISKFCAITGGDCINWSAIALGGASVGTVYGEHCFVINDEDLYEMTVWISKPISIEDGEKFNELNPMLMDLYDFNEAQNNIDTYPKAVATIGGDMLGIVDNINALACGGIFGAEISNDNLYYIVSHESSGYNLNGISLNENTLIFSTDKVIHWEAGSVPYIVDGFAVTEATIDGNNLTVTFKYFADENVNLENYKNYTPDETVTSKYTK